MKILSTVTPRVGVLLSQPVKKVSTLWNPKVHHRVHNSPPAVPILKQTYPVYVLLIHFLNIYFNICYHLRLDLPSGLFPSGVKTKILCALLFCHTPRPPHPSSYGHPNNIGEEYKLWNRTPYATFSSRLLLPPSEAKHPPQHPTLYTLSFCSSINVKDQLPRQHTTSFSLSHRQSERTNSVPVPVPTA